MKYPHPFEVCGASTAGEVLTFVHLLLAKADSETALQSNDFKLVSSIFANWACVFEQIHRHDMTLAEICHVMGAFKKQKTRPKPGSDSTEKTSSANTESDGKEVSPQSESADAVSATHATENPDAAEATDSKVPKRDNHGRRNEEDLGPLNTQHHTHADLGVGCECPTCFRGKLYAFFPRSFVSIVGQAPFLGQRHEIDRLQCNGCQEIFEAPLPLALQNDGVGNGKMYSYSATSVVAMFKYLGVVPWHRQETLQSAMGITVPDASMWDLCENLANIIRPVTRLLQRMAAQAPLFYGDDTSAIILGLKMELKIERRSGKSVERTGCHTTCVIAAMADGSYIAVFRVGIQHTGELLDQVLTPRAINLPPPCIMTDAASANSVTVCDVIMSACNAHALRKFKELESDYPCEAGFILKRYRAVYKNDASAATQNMSDDERLAFHSLHSRPLFKEMCVYAAQVLEEHIVEPNSNLGKACNYLLNHERELAAFYMHPGVPIDNNFAERELRLPVRLRDGAPFFKSKVGAAVAAEIWTLGVTALLAKENLFDYFNALQCYQDDVKVHPEFWLPWCYRERWKALQQRQEASLRAHSPPPKQRAMAAQPMAPLH